MTDFTICRQTIEDAPLDDLIKGKFDSKSGSELSDPAQDLAIAFSAMPVRQILDACHRDYRLSDQLRRTALMLSLAIDGRLESLAEQENGQTRENDEWRRGWEMAGDQMALERAAGR